MRTGLLRWQLEGYPANHTTRLNLWVHVFAVPWFVASVLSIVGALALQEWGTAGGSAVGAALAFGLQGFGHKREPVAPVPFDGPVDAVTRIFAEQFVTFPRFIASGGWLTALRRAK